MQRKTGTSPEAASARASARSGRRGVSSASGSAKVARTAKSRGTATAAGSATALEGSTTCPTPIAPTSDPAEPQLRMRP